MDPYSSTTGRVRTAKTTSTSRRDVDVGREVIFYHYHYHYHYRHRHRHRHRHHHRHRHCHYHYHYHYHNARDYCGKISARIFFHQSLISGCYAILTSPKEGETAVYGYNPALFWVLSVSCWCLAELIFHVVRSECSILQAEFNMSNDKQLIYYSQNPKNWQGILRLNYVMS